MGNQQPPKGTVDPDDVGLSDDIPDSGDRAPEPGPSRHATSTAEPGSARSTSPDEAAFPAGPWPVDAETSGSDIPEASGPGGSSGPTPATSGFARSTETSDEDAVLRFVRGEPTPGSAELSVADGVLLAGGRIAVALRPGPGVVFVRADLPAELVPLRDTVERALDTEGLGNLDRNSTLADAPARDRIGITAARWDLWGHDLADVFAVLAAAGGTGTRSAAGAPPPVAEQGTVGPPPVVEPLPAGPDTPTPAGGGESSWRSRPRVLVLGGLLALALAGTAFAASAIRDTARKTAEVAGSPTEPSASAASLAPLVDYRDPAGRFSLQYPQSWTPVETSDPDVALLLLGPGGGSMLVRLVPLETPIDPAKIEDVKAVTDVVVQSPTVQIVEQKAVELSGIAGYYYLYTFQDASTQQEGVHSHFFLFRDRAMHTLVFQALPTDAFESLAAEFDRISQSYRIL